MYIAQRELKIVDRNTSVATILKPGDEVTDFETWNIHAQRSHLNLEWVKKVEAAPKKSPPPSAPLKKQAAPKAAAQKNEKAQVVKKASASEASMHTTAVGDRSNEAKAPESTPPLVLSKCSICPKEFKSEKALKTHTTVAHK